MHHQKSGCSYLPHEGIFAARALNFRVRNGIGCVRLAIAAADSESHDLWEPNAIVPYQSNRNCAIYDWNHIRFLQGERIDRVLGLLVRPGSARRRACTERPSNHSLSGALTPLLDGRPSLGRGFALRCSQRLSRPRAAFRRCLWRDNRTTVAAFPLVLAY